MSSVAIALGSLVLMLVLIYAGMHVAITPVSYTHLDVYKRQIVGLVDEAWRDDTRAGFLRGRDDRSAT